jgi:hypothetical protein
MYASSRKSEHFKDVHYSSLAQGIGSQGLLEFNSKMRMAGTTKPSSEKKGAMRLLFLPVQLAAHSF